MATRSGGRYRTQNGKRVLVERTGYKPGAETQAAASHTRGKAAPKQEARNEHSDK